MFRSRALTYAILSVFFIQTHIAPIVGAALMISAFVPTQVFGQEVTTETDTPLLDELKRKNNINDPYRNHQEGGAYRTIGESITPSRDLTEVLSKGLERQSRQVDIPETEYSRQQESEDGSEVMRNFEGAAASIALGSGMPSLDGNNKPNFKYAKKSTRKLTRDEEGNLVIEQTEDAPEYVDGMGEEDLVSQEINRNEADFKADEAYGDNNAVIQTVKDDRSQLVTGTNSQSRAYQFFAATAEKANNTNLDPNSGLFDYSKSALNDAANPDGSFFDTCTTETTTESRDLNYPRYEDVKCEKNTAHNLDYCEVERELRIPMVMAGGGLKSCGPGCYEFLFGHPRGEQDWRDPSGDCGIFSESKNITLDLSDGMVLDRVTVNGVVDDHVEFLVDDKLAYSVVMGTSSYSSRMPGSGYSMCEAAHEPGADADGSWNISGERTFAFKRHITAGQKRTYKISYNHLVGGKGDIRAYIRFHFKDTTGKGFGEIVTQKPEGCLDAVSDEYKAYKADGTTTESSSSGEELSASQPSRFESESDSAPYSFCRFDNYEPMEVGTRGYPQEFLDLLEPFYPGDTGNKTWKYNLAGYRCDPLGGQDYCVVDTDTGEEVCYSWDDLLKQPNYCQPYEDDPTCSEQSRSCTDGWSVDIDGEEYCYNETIKYQCETEYTVSREVETTTNTCAGAIPCIGGDCDIGQDERNDRFVEAAVQAEILQHVDADTTCEDPNNPSTCRIFEGEDKYCSWEVTGMGTDCCETPGGIDILAYVSAANGMMDLTKKAQDGLFGETVASEIEGAITSVENSDLVKHIKGSWNTFKEPIAEGWADFSSTITSKAENLIGNSSGEIVNDLGETVSSLLPEGTSSINPISAMKEAFSALKQEAYDFAYEALPTALRDLLFEKAGQEAGEKTGQVILNKNLTNFFSTFMTVYSVYSYVKLALTLLTMCDDVESDMGVRLGQRQCFEVGKDYCAMDFLGVCIQKRQDHCCYDSILARVIMEQAGHQLGKDMTTCEGLTQDELARLDFDQIDLSEWVGLAMESGVIPDEANEQILTGKGELAETRCEVFEVEDPETGAKTTQKECFGELEGGREINTYGRENVSDRTSNRMNGASDYADRARRNVERTSNNLDCSVTPRPPVCNYGFDIRDDADGG